MHNRQIRSLKSTIWVWGLGINFNSSAQIVNIQDWFSSKKGKLSIGLVVLNE